MTVAAAGRERFRLLGLFGLISASALLVVLAVVAINLLSHVSRLGMAATDNTQWGVTELMNEHTRFELALAGGEDGQADLGRRLDILYSRVGLLRNAKAYAFVRNSPTLSPLLDRVSEQVGRYVDIIDNPDEAEAVKLSRLRDLVPETRALVRELGVSTLGETARISDAERNGLRRFIQLVGAIGILLVGLLIALLIFYYSQDRKLRAREGDLIASRERMAATSRVSIDAVVVADHDHRIVDFNDAAVACFGFRREQALGKDMVDLLFSPHHRGQLRASIANLFNGREDRVGNRIEIDALHAGGQELAVEVSLGVAQTPNGPIAIAFLRDITQRRKSDLALRKALDDAMEAERAKSRFLAVISHEIRTPINGIIGALELLHGTALDQSQSNHVRLAFQSGEALLSIIRNILDISKMDVTGIELQPAPLALEALCRSAAEVAEAGQSDRENRTTIDIGPDVPRFVTADGDRLQQVLLNLLNNAQKFTYRGDIRLSVVKVGGTGGQPLIEFSVADTGIGFDAKRAGNLFKDFSTLDNTHQRKTGGTGLGLAISRRIVMAMGGEIGAHGEKGMGSRFWFRVALPVAAQPATEGPSPQAAAGLERSISILLVDDNVTNLVVTKERLLSAGFSVDTAAGGLEAVAMGSSKVYDIILMDISMPEIDGLEATRRLRASGTPGGRVPIIALTAAAMRENVNSALDAGMDGFLSKPMRRATLIAEIERVVGMNLQKDAGQGLDPSVLEELGVEVGVDAMRMALQAFNSELQEHQLSLSRVQDDQDLRTFERVCHSIAGSASAVGALELARLASELEAGCKAQLASQSMSRTRELMSMIEQARAAIRDKIAA